MKEYIPGQGSYKVEEAGSISGVSTTGNVDNNTGTLTFPISVVNIDAKDVPISLSATFNSDHLYSTVIPRIAKDEDPSDTDQFPETALMTLPPQQSNYYPICDGWYWNLPYIQIGEDNIFKICMGNGKIYDLSSVISESVYDNTSTLTDEGLWVEGYHVKYGSESGYVRSLTVAVPEEKIIIMCSVRTDNSGTGIENLRVVLSNDFFIYLADGTRLSFTEQGYIESIKAPATSSDKTKIFKSLIHCNINSIEDEYDNTLIVNSGSASTEQVSSNFAGSWLLDGNAGYIDISNIRARDFYSNPWTMEFYFKASSTSTEVQYLLGNCDPVAVPTTTGTTSYGLLVKRTGTALAISLSTNGTAFNLASALACGTVNSYTTWYHLAVSWDGSYYRVFLDGVLTKEIASTLPLLTSNDGCLIEVGNHSRSTATSLRGYLDEFRASSNLCSYISAFTKPSSEFTTDSVLTYEDLTFVYNQEVISGTITAIDSDTTLLNKKFTVSDVTNAHTGDLITIGDETFVIFDIDSNVVTLSGKLDLAPTVGKSYKIHKGDLQKIVHKDGRCVKFYKQNNNVVTLLSSDSDVATFKDGDMFLNRLVIDDATNRLVRIESLETLKSEDDSSFVIDESQFGIIQQNTFEYHTTTENDYEVKPETDYIIVKNHLGAITKYTFQKGGFCSHQYNNLNYQQGRVRGGTGVRTINIEKTDFPISVNDWININRFDQEAAEDVMGDDYLSESDYKTQSAVNTALSSTSFVTSSISSIVAITATGESALTGILAVSSPIGFVASICIFAISLFASSIAKRKAKNAEPVSSWVQIESIKSSTKLQLFSDLAVVPHYGDTYTIIKNSANNSTTTVSKTEQKNSYTVYLTSVSGLAIGHKIFIRTEGRVITYVGSNYVTVDEGFSFCPIESESVLLIKDTTSTEYSYFYLNKPKIVKVETKQQESDDTWQATSYTYTYQLHGQQEQDDISGGGFTLGDIDGPSANPIEPDTIATISNSIISWKENTNGEQEDYTQKVTAFDYSSSLKVKGENMTFTCHKSDDNWIFDESIRNVFGRPCANAPYYGITDSYLYKGDGDTNNWRIHTDLDYDSYGRVTRQRVYSPTLAGGQAISTFTEYVGIGIDTGSAQNLEMLDLYEEFESNPYDIDYQDIYNEKHCFELVGGIVKVIDNNERRQKVFNKFDSKLNIIESRNIEVSGLDTEEIKIDKYEDSSIIPENMIAFFTIAPDSNWTKLDASGPTDLCTSGTDGGGLFLRSAFNPSSGIFGNDTHSHTSFTLTTGTPTSGVFSKYCCYSTYAGTGYSTLNSTTHSTTHSLRTVKNIPQHYNALPAIINNENATMSTSSFIFYDGVKAPTGWTKVNITDGSLIRCSSTDLGGYTPVNGVSSFYCDHEDTFTTASAGGGTSASYYCGGGSYGMQVSHTHTFNHTHNGEDHLPPYYNLIAISPNADTNKLPLGAITFFAENEIPEGWKIWQECYDKRFIRINSIAGKGGTLDTHTHTYTGYTSTQAAGIDNNYLKNSGSYGRGDIVHNHSINHSHSSANHMPKHVELLACEYVGCTGNVTQYDYDNETNDLIKITKPMGNEVELEYGTGWKQSFVTKDIVSVNNNIAEGTQYFVNSYDYDIKGRMLNKKTGFVISTTGDIESNQYDSEKYPYLQTLYTYDGMNRLLNKKSVNTSDLRSVETLSSADANKLFKIVSLGDTTTLDWIDLGTSENPVVGEIFTATGEDGTYTGTGTVYPVVEVLRQSYDDGNSNVANWEPVATTIDYLGFKTVTTYDRYYRPVDVRTYKPNTDIAGSFEVPNEETDWLITSVSQMTYDPILGVVTEAKKQTRPDGDEWVITKTDYDKRGRSIRTMFKNTDKSLFDTDTSYKLMTETEYDDINNAVVNKIYFDESGTMTDANVDYEFDSTTNKMIFVKKPSFTASFTQTRIENDWLGRGVLKEISWTGKNASGEQRITQNYYNYIGNLLYKKLPSGEKYSFYYDTNGKLEKTVYPDDSTYITNYDKNGNVIYVKDAKDIETYMNYNSGDLAYEITSDLGDSSTYAAYKATTKYTHFGPASTDYSEGTSLSNLSSILSKEFKYYYTGAPIEIAQTMGNKTITTTSSYDAAGNQTSIGVIGSGAWEKTLTIVPQYHPVSDTYNFNMLAIKDGTDNVLVKKFDFLGLLKQIDYGTIKYMSYDYDMFLRTNSIVSGNQSTSEPDDILNLLIKRDFSGNITSKEGESYTYDGMNRLATAEGNNYTYDELSNLKTVGFDKSYEYEQAGSGNQMRLKHYTNKVYDYYYYYDNNGNITKVGGRFDYGDTPMIYDNNNRLRELTYNVESGQKTEKYTYDPNGLRFKKEDGDGNVYYTLYSGDDILYQEKYNDQDELEESIFNIVF